MLRGFALLAVVIVAGCTPPANIAGTYTVAVTDGQNGCAFPNFTQGTVTNGIPFTVTQNGASATGTVGGVVGVYLGLTFGNNVFTGTVLGNGFLLKLTGTNTLNQGSCAYTLDAVASGSIVGSAISGQIDYTSVTNNSAACGSLVGCHTDQTFSGTR